MKKVKTFFHIFKNSLFPQHNYYHKLLRTKFNLSLKYFLALIFIITVFHLIRFALVFNQQKKIFKKNLYSAVSKFPDNLEIKINKGFLKTNYNYPFFLWIDYFNKKILVLVIDESAIPEKINQYNSLFLITSNDFVVKNSQKKNFKLSLNYLPIKMQINKNSAILISKLISNSLIWISIVLFISIIIFFPIILLTTYLFYLFITSLLSFIIYKIILGKKITLAKVFQISLHSSTLPLFLIFFLYLFNLKFNNFFISFMFLITLFLTIAIYEAYFDIPHHKNYTNS